MTPDERAWKLIEPIVSSGCVDFDAFQGVLAAAIQAAVEEEREACAAELDVEAKRYAAYDRGEYESQRCAAAGYARQLRARGAR